MKIKLIAVDMDGTFLRDDNSYDKQRFGRQLQQLVDRGIHFVAASGSQLDRLKQQFSGFEGAVDFISENGSIVANGDKLLSVKEIPINLLEELLKIIKTHFNIPIASTTITGEKAAYVDDQEPQAYFDLKNRYYSTLKRVPEILEYEADKFADQLVKVGLSFAPGDDAKQQIQLLRDLLPSGLASLNSGFNTELIGPAGVNKRTGLKTLQAKYHIADQEVMTFGDNENDLAMLTMTPYGFAMANANDSIKSAVTRQAPSNNHDGVLTIIDELLGGSQFNG